MSIELLDTPRRTAVCYLTDGGDDAEMRSWSAASVRRFCPDFDVFVCTVDGLYRNPRPDERLVDLGTAFHAVYGRDARASDGCTGNTKFPQIIFAKFLLPFAAELAGYESVILLDADIEIVSSGFADIARIRLPDTADVGLCPSQAFDPSTFRNNTLSRAYPRLWSPDFTYHNVGLVLMRGVGRWLHRGYVSRLRQCRNEALARKFFLPEEYGANIYLSVCTLPTAFHVIPEVRQAKRRGATGDLLGSAYALHYCGPRKDAIRPYWRRRFEIGEPTDPLNLIPITP